MVGGEILPGEIAVHCTCTQKYSKAIGNEETGQPPVQSNRAGTRKYPKPIVNRETSQPPVQSYRANGWGNHARITSCVLHMYLKILKGNSKRETGQPLVPSNRTGTRKYLKLIVNGETGKPPVQSYRASGGGNHARRTSCALSMYTKIFKGNWKRGN
ncbi:unnamed protein product [Prunus armeniaca]